MIVVHKLRPSSTRKFMVLFSDEKLCEVDKATIEDTATRMGLSAECIVPPTHQGKLAPLVIPKDTVVILDEADN